jgi:hypothetical protein
MRGCDPREVEAFLAQLSDDQDLPVPGFARVVRGYDAAQVDLRFEQFKAVRRRNAVDSPGPRCIVHEADPTQMTSSSAVDRRGAGELADDPTSGMLT